MRPGTVPLALGAALSILSIVVLLAGLVSTVRWPIELNTQTEWGQLGIMWGLILGGLGAICVATGVILRGKVR
jgi:hypothetical protein